MDNIDFLSEILTSSEEYWCVAKKIEYRAFAEDKRGPDEIFFIAIPLGTRRGIDKKDILLSDLENLRRCEVSNIPLSKSYAPFQQGITMWNMYRGFSVGGDPRKFLKAALEIESNNIDDYTKLLEPEMVIKKVVVL